LDANGDSELLLAPIGETGAADDDGDAIYRFVRTCDREKQRSEDVRLLYVAATRAVQQLHLLATVLVDADDAIDIQVSTPRSASLLAAMWPAVSNMFVERANAARGATPTPAPSAQADNISASRVAMRLCDDSPAPSLPDTIAIYRDNPVGTSSTVTNEIDFEWAGDSARHVGTVVHGCLQIIAEEGLETWNEQRINASRAMIACELSRHGVNEQELASSTDRVVRAITNTLVDARGRWILQLHSNARSEWRLSGVVGNAVAHVAIDRYFVDEAGARWIIDFKTGGHDGADIDAFLDNERLRYRRQLETYAALLESIKASGANSESSSPIKIGLYFPMHAGWREWEWRSNSLVADGMPVSATLPLAPLRAP
jgi:ATP-dependent exoDNAse (exonuclease V) beta subunit